MGDLADPAIVERGLRLPSTTATELSRSEGLVYTDPAELASASRHYDSHAIVGSTAALEF